MQSESAGLLLNGKTILIVEDEAIISFMLEDMMDELGATHIAHAATIAEALTAIDARRPQVAILDLNLGGELSWPGGELLKDAAVLRLDEALEHYNEHLPRLKEFIQTFCEEDSPGTPCPKLRTMKMFYYYSLEQLRTN